MKLKLAAATLLYRWNLSSSIVSVIFSALAFVGVFVVLFALPWYLLFAAVVITIFGSGFLLDRVLKFWEAQATVGTIRNQYLVDVLYQKEALLLEHSTLPQMRALRALLNNPRAIVDLDESITRLEQTLRDKRWTIKPDENVYG